MRQKEKITHTGGHTEDFSLSIYLCKGCLGGRKGDFTGGHFQAAQILSVFKGVERFRKGEDLLSGTEPYHESDGFSDQTGFQQFRWFWPAGVRVQYHILI